MKWIFLILLSLPHLLWAKPVVLLSYYDAFAGAEFNNSEKVAKRLDLAFKGSGIELKLCGLNTVFDKSYGQLETCYKALKEAPVLVLGLGESNCNFKIESLGRNFDHTFGPDNEGQERDEGVIIPEASAELGFTYPLAHMYCSVSQDQRNNFQVSNSAGSFVCNNTAFRFAYHYPEIASGFIHVPSNHCSKLDKKTDLAVSHLTLMIEAAVKNLQVNNNVMTKLPTHKKELELLRARYRKEDKCLYEFFRRSRGVDEKSSWPF